MNVNKLFLGGNITRDIKLSYTQNQTAIADFGIAVNRKWKGKDGQDKSEVCFVDCQIFGKQAETVNKYVKKGDPIFLEGRLKLDQWEAADGSKRSKLKMTVESFQFLNSKPAGEKTTANAPPDDDDIPW